MFGNNPSTGTLSQGWTGASLFAEIASCQMEYKYLAHITGKEKYFKKVDNVIAILEKEQWTAKGRKGSNPGNGANEGLFAVRWDPRTGKGLGGEFSGVWTSASVQLTRLVNNPSETATVGAWADSGVRIFVIRSIGIVDSLANALDLVRVPSQGLSPVGTFRKAATQYV